MLFCGIIFHKTKWFLLVKEHMLTTILCLINANHKVDGRFLNMIRQMDEKLVGKGYHWIVYGSHWFFFYFFFNKRNHFAYFDIQYVQQTHPYFSFIWFLLILESGFISVIELTVLKLLWPVFGFFFSMVLQFQGGTIIILLSFYQELFDGCRHWTMWFFFVCDDWFWV